MLTIKRVPTVLSNYQEEIVGCGKNCLGKCCLPVSTLPLYAFKKRESFNEKSVALDNNSDGEEALQIDFLNTLLLGQWEDRVSRGLFRYDVTACETKVIEGEYGFVAQLNEGRHLKKRPTEFRVDRVLQPFDGNKFNFTKVGQEEALFRFEENPEGVTKYFSKAPADFSVNDSSNVVVINVSPIEYGHVLLIPRVLECLPQRIDEESFLLALHMAAEAGSPYFRLGYNSLGAFATINHLHFQGSQKSGVKVSSLMNYPVRGLVFEGGNTLKDLSDVVAKSCICLQDNNIPFNVLISDSGRRIFLFPQCYAEKQALGEVSQELLDTQVNPAVWEISGHMVLKRKKDYDEASEDYAWRLLEVVSLSKERLEEVKAYIFEAIGLVIADDENGENDEEATVTSAPTPTRTQLMSQGCLVLQ
ncbi:GDP-L-galactose phosphorylase 1 [Acorus gramineus]|uniref:GDP-D-glucose phosphorylase 1 n=1 Tax=Acorus gramineus TaxID=55184 RepID=A0AAV9BFK1_ACOGR|nr:GDP-L-galactose phosphorylase 1 [Acorus gramineus]